MQMYAVTADIAVCDSYLLRNISWYSLSTISTSPFMLASLHHLGDVSGSNLQGAWMGRKLKIRGCY